MTKYEIRKLCLANRNKISKNEIKEKSSEILEKIFESSEYNQCDWIFTYINMGSEVETTPLIEKAWHDKKHIAVPVALKVLDEMYFIKINSFEGMRKTKMGVLEPCVDAEFAVFPTAKTLFITPGSAFDINKNRCGYGGGYYDRYFEKHTINTKIGLAFDIQVLDNIPTGKFDVKLDRIITEKRTIY